MTIFGDTYDTNTPLGSDDPAEADDRIREVKAAVQEREDVDHYWPLTGTEVSDVDSGEHRKVTLRVTTTPDNVADKGFLYSKDADSVAELHYLNENDDEIQVTIGGGLNVSAGAPTRNDSDSELMVQNSIYKAQATGFITAWTTNKRSTQIEGLIGATNPPTYLIASNDIDGAIGQDNFISFLVPKDYYFQVTHSNGCTINWTPLAPGSGNPIDQD